MAEGGYIQLEPMEELEDIDEEDKEDETDFGGSFRFSHFNTTIHDDDDFSFDTKTPLLDQLESRNEEAVNFIKTIYKKTNFSKIFVTKDEEGFVRVSLQAINSKKYLVTDEGIQGNPGKKLKGYLGIKIRGELGEINTDVSQLISQIEELKKENEKILYEKDELKTKTDNITRLQKQVKIGEDRLTEYHKENKKLKNEIEKSTSPQERKELEKKLKEKMKQINDLQKDLEEYKQNKERINEEITELKEQIENTTSPTEIQEQIEHLENMRERELTRHEELFERMSLRNKVKYIFKKYGVTVFSILTAVGTVIGVIVSNLKSGLANVAKGLGNGLKDLGKKLAGILPGMIGAIVSFLFKTAGEAIGFLAKNSWLLILLVVTFAIEQYKKK